MLKRDITYTSWDGEEITEAFYFNFSKAEIVEMDLVEGGGLAAKLQRMIDQQKENPKAVIDTFKWIIAKAYGERSDDGKFFLKDDDILKKFMGTAAYHELFMLLVTDAVFSAAFINGLMPKDLQDHLPKTMPTVPRAPDADIIGEVLANELVDEEFMATRMTPPDGITINDDAIRKALEEKGLPHEEIEKILGS